MAGSFIKKTATLKNNLKSIYIYMICFVVILVVNYHTLNLNVFCLYTNLTMEDRVVEFSCHSYLLSVTQATFVHC